MSDTETLPDLTRAEWIEEAKRRFGDDPRGWKFVCPSCGTVQSIQDFIDLGVDKKQIETVIGFSCIGRWTPGCVRQMCEKGVEGPCNYAGGGLLRINPQTVIDEEGKEHKMFAFAEEES